MKLLKSFFIWVEMNIDMFIFGPFHLCFFRVLRFHRVCWVYDLSFMCGFCVKKNEESWDFFERRGFRAFVFDSCKWIEHFLVCRFCVWCWNSEESRDFEGWT